MSQDSVPPIFVSSSSTLINVHYDDIRIKIISFDKIPFYIKKNELRKTVVFSWDTVFKLCAKSTIDIKW